MDFPSDFPSFPTFSFEGNGGDKDDDGAPNEDDDDAGAETAESYTAEEVAEKIYDGVKPTPDAPTILTSKDMNQEINRRFGNIQDFASKVSSVIKAERGRRELCRYDRFQTVTPKLLGAEKLRKILTDLNDQTMAMVDIATIAGVELFVAGVTEAIYMTFGK